MQRWQPQWAWPQLHDVGKIGLPDAILHKPGRLTTEEFDLVKKHCQIGLEIVQPFSEEEWRSLRQSAHADLPITSPSDDPLLSLIATIAMNHHEKWDGTGYPRGLAGPQIPEPGRITSVADVFDALTSARSYKAGYSIEASVTMMEKGRGTQFDPRVLDAMTRRLGDLRRIRKEMPDPLVAGSGITPSAKRAAR